MFNTEQEFVSHVNQNHHYGIVALSPYVDVDVVVTSKGSTALIIFSKNGKLKTVQFLVDAGADINFQNQLNVTSLIVASQNGHLDIVRYLKEQGADINLKTIDETNALMYAAEGGHLDIVNYLLDQGAQIDEQDKNKQTALMAAAAKGKSDVVKCLRDRGANLHLKSISGGTAKDFAEKFGHIETSELLPLSITVGEFMRVLQADLM